VCPPNDDIVGRLRQLYTSDGTDYVDFSCPTCQADSASGYYPHGVWICFGCGAYGSLSPDRPPVAQGRVTVGDLR